MKKLLLLLCLISGPIGIFTSDGQTTNEETILIEQLDRINDSLELFPTLVYNRTHKLFERQLADRDSSLAAITLSQLSGFYNILQNNRRMLETTDSLALILPKTPSFEARFRVATSRNRAAARKQHVEDSRRWVDTLSLLVQQTDDVRKNASYLLSNGITLVREGKLAEALDVIRELDKIVDHQTQRKQEATHSLAAVVYSQMNKLPESDEQINLARSLMDPATRPISRADRLEFLAQNRAREGEFELALTLLDSAEMLLKQHDAPLNLAQFLGTRGQIIGELGNWAEAKLNFQKAHQLSEEIDAHTGIYQYWMGISERGLDHYDRAIEYFERGVNQSLQRKLFSQASLISNAAYQSFLWKGKHEQALVWYKKQIQYRDSVMTTDFELKQDLAASKYETFRAKQNTEQAIASAQLAKRNNQLLASVLIGLLLFGFTGYYALSKRQQSVKLMKEQAQQKAAEMTQRNLNLNQQLNIQALTLTQKNALLRSLEADLTDMRSGNNAANAQAITKLSKTIRNDRTKGEDWGVFISSIKVMHGDLFKALEKQHPHLTSNDHRLVAMIRLNMSTKEMAKALSISESGIKKARYRIRKKIELESSISLNSYFVELEQKYRTNNQIKPTT